MSKRWLRTIALIAFLACLPVPAAETSSVLDSLVKVQMDSDARERRVIAVPVMDSFPSLPPPAKSKAVAREWKLTRPGIDTVGPAKTKSEAVAYGWAVGSTLLPTLLGIGIISTIQPEDGNPYAGMGQIFLGGLVISGGVIVGPSIGQFYAGSIGKAFIGMAIRIFVPILAISLIPESRRDLNGNEKAAITLTALSPGIIYSLFDTHYAVKRFNERARAKRTTTSFDLYPTLSRTANGGLGAGMMARVGF